MARPKKVDNPVFPVWAPLLSTQRKFNSPNFRIRYNALRISSNHFIRRKDVKDSIRIKNLNHCAKCGDYENLQIDHIVSVWLVADNPFLIKILNTKDNLQLLCGKCNSKKSPEVDNGTP